MSPYGFTLLTTLMLGLCLTASAEPLDEPLKPLPPVPVQDPQRVELGRQLFNETRLSVNNSLSCASCHHLEKGGADNKQFSIGFDGKPLVVNTPSVLNASLNFREFWNGRAATLEDQIHAVVESPTEMGSNWEHVVQMLSTDPTYRSAFANAYPNGVTVANVENALATYERTLLSTNSRFDQYLQGNTDILSLDEKYGYQRFKDYGCIACHQGVNIGGNMYQKLGVMGDYFQARGNPTESDLGRYLVTKDEEDRNVFKVPSLRNVAVNAPYFHDGAAKTLEEAVDVMFKFQLGRVPSDEDKALIIKFLKTLTGEWGGKPL
ncbi:cytochrome b6 [Pseudomonas sp. FW306-02-F02-AA]|uniref:Cytochrome B6 n=1 Tax=Pseudomonas fluorescens TaxID=294 RepID=A0A0N9W714_PSEFL|nr:MULTISPECIES: cytochrome c peroxidase [Pseudomonas]ALI02535.1 cytochrome B6 [Pseudomonas fluorescens]PMZ04976.1 cytochrome b6 [Pseudomonas sp. FW306-02-F02-AB]PMZ10955.1 cytochrome b6 [Pseudomonas sp. FW306-02-H06C]PMZ13668.1 cytochrome b6 [Pseudomonas sp. FW306-02-F02-AA]PMZ18423.1 cytochrome b6 [Pseudomonas sp. FW306-02-F08-AA]